MDVREPILVQQPLTLPPRFAVELSAEIKRLVDHGPGRISEIQTLYRIYPCATSRRRELQKLSVDRIARSLKIRQGKIELTCICEPTRVTLELSYAERADELPNAASVQDSIPLALFFPEFDPHDREPPSGGGIRTAPRPAPRPSAPKRAKR
jgi:hypothetical protein